MTELSELKSYLERLGDAHEAFADSYKSHAERLGRENDSLRDRLEDIEAKSTLPRGPGGTGQLPEFKVYHTATGEIYELPSTVKMAGQ